MNKKMKFAMVIATALILLGGVVFTSAMAAHGWDFTKLTTVKYETDTYVIEESINNISVITDTADVILLKSTDEKIRVVTYLPEGEKHTVALTGDTLSVEREDGFHWSMFFGINFRSPKITVYLPEGEYASLNIKSDTSDVKISSGSEFDSISVKVSTGDVKCNASATESLKIKASTGDVFVKDITAGKIDITTSTGNIKLTNILCLGNVKAKMSTGDATFTNVNCKNLTVNADTGDVELKSVIADEKFNIRTDTGDVEFDGSDAAEIYIKTNTGDVEGTLLTEKIFVARSDTGKIKVPASVTGGKCEITTDTGDIVIKIK